MRIIPSITLLALAALVAGCGSDDAKKTKPSSGSSGDEPTKVVAAFYPLAWIAEEVGGDNVEVHNLTPPGVEPHDLELSPKDVAAIEQADVVLYLGHGFQPSVEDAAKNSDAKKVDVLELDGIDLNDPVEGDEHADEGGGEGEAAGEAVLDVDPHVWLDPTRLATITKSIGSALDADDSATLDALEQLDSDFEAGLKTCERREIFTSHAAFGYLANRYDLEQVAISGLSPEAEPLPQDLKRVADEARERGATTIYFETLVSPKLAKQVAKEIGAKAAVLDPIEGIAQDRLNNGTDYLDVMRENLDALRTGLACT